MDVSAYCHTLEKKFAEWKARLYDVIHIVDKLSEGEKETVANS
jgi:SHS2 domain-containing protein